MTLLKSKYPLIILFILGVILSFYAISLDDFLNLWDERFHALVAKNMIGSPLMPSLYESPFILCQPQKCPHILFWLPSQFMFALLTSYM